MRQRDYATSLGGAVAVKNHIDYRWRIEALVTGGTTHDVVVVYADTDPSYFRGRHWQATDAVGHQFDVGEFGSLREVAVRAIEVSRNRRDLRLFAEGSK